MVGGRSADGGGRGAAGAGHGGGQGGRLQRAAVQRSRLKQTAGGAVALSGAGGGDLPEEPDVKHGVNFSSTELQVKRTWRIRKDCSVPVNCRVSVLLHSRSARPGPPPAPPGKRQRGR